MYALVTGAAVGIGAAIARALAKDGYSVILCFNHSTEKAGELGREINSPAVFSCDLSDPEKVKEMAGKVLHQFRRIDLLVNNAGISEFSVLQDISDESWRKMIDTNLSAAFTLSRELVPPMIEAKKGTIINIASMWGEVGASCELHYSAAKGGLIAMTKAMAKELGPSGIRVNCVSPGVIETNMLNKLRKEDLDALAEETPLGRLGKPEDVAAAVSFLASDKAGFITGQDLGVNGGFVI